MASGYGLHGGPSRCFPFWQEVLACYAVNANPDDPSRKGLTKCQLPLEDYYECLYHRKEAKRVSELQAAYRKKILEDPRVDAPTEKQIRRLGMLEAPDEEKNIKRPKWLPHGIKDQGIA
ncbi:hypothetical protein P152DRAFT_389659 [Eremomyces bilateralis CBS 781.70]|uniref:NADH dehydrogenase [ubiquinone] iron-sulfur protein 5 n=1 Tax=Eremomyces bilateralis CBS 781.70 TaxID=1392243 RepID=A0A6G1GF64_9PEZI|nr:uncharacterized protein P152DRAFT_389659 [Eremomyces bilateralis CBS 781.70]KAF1816551.1 hypothetical protein P152DRAFT_389659 [Eremomyces bilateralis CBS 781.70]